MYRFPNYIINGKRYGNTPIEPHNFPKIDTILYDNEKVKTRTIRIPREYARTNTAYPGRYETLEKDNVECYELILFSQVGDPFVTRKPTYVLLRLPESDKNDGKKYAKIIMYHDGGVEFDPAERKYVLRVYDELDRRIIIGFCIKHQDSLEIISHSNMSEKEDFINPTSIDLHAKYYTADEMPKRLKTGRRGNRPNMSIGVPRPPRPYEESGIFSAVRFLNEA